MSIKRKEEEEEIQSQETFQFKANNKEKFVLPFSNRPRPLSLICINYCEKIKIKQ